MLAPIAHLVERRSCKADVVSSNPTGGTKQCGCGEIGRRTRFRFWRRKAWGFESLHPHHTLLKYQSAMTQVGQVDPEGLISLTEIGALPVSAS